MCHNQAKTIDINIIMDSSKNHDYNITVYRLFQYTEERPYNSSLTNIGSQKLVINKLKISEWYKKKYCYNIFKFIR